MVTTKSTEDREQRQCHNTKRGKTPHGQAAVFCVDCRQFYCESCELSHKLFDFGSTHQFQSISQVDATTVDAAQQQTRIPRCDQHPVLQLDMYCDTCHVPVCAKCCVLTHKQHEYRELAVVAQEFQDKLSKLTTITGAHIHKLDQHVEGLQTSHCDIQKDTDEACQEVDQAADEMIDLVNKRRQHLKQQLRDAEERALVEVKAACKDTELNKATTQSLLSYMQALQESGNITDQIVHTPGLQEQLHQQETVPLHAVTWTACFERETNSVAALDAMLGTVNVDHSDVTSPAAADVEQMKLGQPLKKFKCSFRDATAAIAVLGDCVCAAKLRGSELYVHNIVTAASKQLALSGLQAVGMTATHDNTLVITSLNKTLHFVTVIQHNMDIATHSVKDITFEAQHISIHPATGQLVIADKTNKAIVLCDTEGNMQQRINIQTDVGRMQCAVATEDGFAVLDYTASRIHRVDRQGVVTHTYGRGDGEDLHSPWQLARDSQGRLIVADQKNYRLHLVDANGRLSCYLLTRDNGLKYPLSVWLDEATSLLYVTHWPGSSEIWVYKWPTAAAPAAANSSDSQHKLLIRVARYIN